MGRRKVGGGGYYGEVCIIWRLPSHPPVIPLSNMTHVMSMAWIKKKSGPAKVLAPFWEPIRPHLAGPGRTSSSDRCIYLKDVGNYYGGIKP